MKCMPSPTRRRLAAALAASPLATLPAVGQAQEWPAKPIRILSPSAPGGSTDTIARLLADRFAKALKVAVVVENRPGGTGTVALDALARSAPELAERWQAAMGTRPAPAGPDEFARMIRSDWDTWKSVIERGKITLD